MNWRDWLREEAIAAVLPKDLRIFAKPVREGLVVFLSELPNREQRALLHSQMSLPVDATFSQRLTQLARDCPVLHKLGQVLARDQRLCSDLRRQLQSLESLPASVPLKSIRALLTKELGPLELRGIKLFQWPIAEASVAVVIPFWQRENQQQGVLKLLKPGIEDRLALELALLQRVGQALDERCEELGIPRLDYETVFHQVSSKLREEVHLKHEQDHLSEAAAFYANNHRVLIPRLLEHCTTRVTAMERVFGDKVTSCGGASRFERRYRATLIAKSLIAAPLISRDESALLHGDPHAGNLCFTRDGRLAILDWSLVGRISRTHREAVGQILLGAMTLDESRIYRALSKIDCQRSPDLRSFHGVIVRSLTEICCGQLPGLTWLTRLLDEATTIGGLRAESELMTLRKSMLTLQGVVTELSENPDTLDHVLRLEFLRSFCLEWPERFVRLPHERQYATTLSNGDLFRVVLGLPANAVRFWSRLGRALSTAT